MLSNTAAQTKATAEQTLQRQSQTAINKNCKQQAATSKIMQVNHQMAKTQDIIIFLKIIQTLQNFKISKDCFCFIERGKRKDERDITTNQCSPKSCYMPKALSK